MATETRFHFAWIPRCQKHLPFLHQPGSILGVDRNLPTCSMGLFSGKSCVFVPTFVKELVRPIRQNGPSQCRDRIALNRSNPFIIFATTCCSEMPRRSNQSASV